MQVCVLILSCIDCEQFPIFLRESKADECENYFPRGRATRGRKRTLIREFKKLLRGR